MADDPRASIDSPFTSAAPQDSLADLLPDPPADPWRPTPRELILLLATLGLALIVYLALTDKVAGLFADDAWYALLGYSLATGNGYQVINSPTPGIFPLYPPLYPFLLSLVIRLFPVFPENVIALKSVSLVSLLGLGALTFFYLRRYRGVPMALALFIPLLALLCQPLMFLATSTLMSECLFALLAMALFLVAERVVSKAAGGSGGAPYRVEPAWLVTLGVLAGAIFLARSISIALIAGVLIYLLKQRLFRELVVVALIFGVVAGSWTLYARSRTPTAAERLEQGGNIVMSYSEQLWQREAGTAGDLVTISEFPARMARNLRSIFGPDMIQLVAPPLFRWFNQLARDYPGPVGVVRVVLPALLSILVLIGYVSLVARRLTAAEIGLPLIFGLIVIWPFNPLRFLAPLAPFIFFYLLTGTAVVIRRLGRQTGAESRWEERLEGRALLGAATVLLVISLVGHGLTLWNRQELDLTGFSWQMAFDDNEKMMRWVEQNIPRAEVLASNNPALAALFTGYKTVALDLNPERWEMFRRLRIRYVLLHRYDGNVVPPLGSYPVLYRVRNSANYRVIDLGPLESRPALP